MAVVAAATGCTAGGKAVGAGAAPTPAEPRPVMTCPAVSPPRPQAIDTRLRAAWTLVCEYGRGAHAGRALFRGDPLRSALLRVHPQPASCDANFGHLAGVYRYDATHLANALTIKLYGCEGVVRPDRRYLQTWTFDQAGLRQMYRLLHRVRAG